MTPARILAHPAAASSVSPREATRRIGADEKRTGPSRLIRALLRGPTDMSEVTNGGLAILFGLNVLFDENDGILSASSRALAYVFGRPEPFCVILIAWGGFKLASWWLGDLRARRGAAYGGVFVWAWLAALSWDTAHASLAQVVFPWLSLMSALTIIRLGGCTPSRTNVDRGGK